MSKTNDGDSAESSINVVVLQGEVKGEPVERTLASGGVVVQFDVGTRLEGISSTAPIAMADPPASVVDIIADGASVVVVGGVRRRFFRVGGQTQSRTEVVATRVVPVRRRAAVGRLLAEATAALDGS
jgi:single-strand DNA-binding protein